MTLLAQLREMVLARDVATHEIHTDSEVIGEDYGDAVVRRTTIESAARAGKPLWICAGCGKAVVIRCRRRMKSEPRTASKFFLRHHVHNPGCVLSRSARWTHDQIRAARYHGQREGPAHRHLKELLYRSLQADGRFSDVKQEATWRGVCQPELWRRPDVSARFGSQPMAFEIQLSTTFLDVMVARRDFYVGEEALLVWVVADFDAGWTSLGKEDAFYPNNRNIFRVDEPSLNLSLARAACHLHVHWHEPDERDGEIGHRPREGLIEFGALTLDTEHGRVYFFDYEGQRDVLIAQQQERKQLAARNAMREAFESFWRADRVRERSWQAYERAEGEWRVLQQRLRAFDVELPDYADNRLERVLDAFYSVRDFDGTAESIVGYNYPNLHQLAHDVLNHRKDVLWPFFLALDCYGRGDHMRPMDRKGTWARNVKTFLAAMVSGEVAFRTPPERLALLVFLFPALAAALRATPAERLRES